MTQTPSTGRSKHGRCALGLASPMHPILPQPLLALDPDERRTDGDTVGTMRTSFARDSFCYPIVKDERSNCISLVVPALARTALRVHAAHTHFRRRRFCALAIDQHSVPSVDC
jgi:hypothetical protein